MLVRLEKLPSEAVLAYQVDCFHMFSEWIGQLFIIMGMACLFSEPGHLTQLTKKRQLFQTDSCS